MYCAEDGLCIDLAGTCVMASYHDNISLCREREGVDRKSTALLLMSNGAIDVLMAPSLNCGFSIGPYGTLTGLNGSNCRRCIKEQWGLVCVDPAVNNGRD